MVSKNAVEALKSMDAALMAEDGEAYSVAWDAFRAALGGSDPSSTFAAVDADAKLTLVEKDAVSGIMHRAASIYHSCLGPDAVQNAKSMAFAFHERLGDAVKVLKVA